MTAAPGEVYGEAVAAKPCSSPGRRPSGWGSLLKAEWSRLFARRVTGVMLALVLLMLALAGFAVGRHSHPHTPATLAHAEAFITSQREQNLAQCLTDARSGVAGPEGQPPPTEAQCQQDAQRFQPSVDEFEGYQFTFRRDMATMLFLFGGLLAMFGFVVGASFVGAEWSTGGMMTVLVWRPRRSPVLAGKLVALLAGVGSVAALTSVAWTVAMWAAARVRGDATLTAGLVASLALRDVRGLALTLACTAAGFAVASYGRHAATALGAAVGYLVVVEVVLRVVLSTTHITRPERFYLTSYVFAWLDDGTTYAADGHTSWSIGAVTGALVLGAVVAGTLIAAFTALRARDVT